MPRRSRNVEFVYRRPKFLQKFFNEFPEDDPQNELDKKRNTQPEENGITAQDFLNEIDAAVVVNSDGEEVEKVSSRKNGETWKKWEETNSLKEIQDRDLSRSRIDATLKDDAPYQIENIRAIEETKEEGNSIRFVSHTQRRLCRNHQGSVSRKGLASSSDQNRSRDSRLPRRSSNEPPHHRETDSTDEDKRGKLRNQERHGQVREGSVRPSAGASRQDRRSCGEPQTREERSWGRRDVDRKEGFDGDGKASHRRRREDRSRSFSKDSQSMRQNHRLDDRRTRRDSELKERSKKRRGDNPLSFDFDGDD